MTKKKMMAVEVLNKDELDEDEPHGPPRSYMKMTMMMKNLMGHRGRA
jgi:hypothetical protein